MAGPVGSLGSTCKGHRGIEHNPRSLDRVLSGRSHPQGGEAEGGGGGDCALVQISMASKPTKKVMGIEHVVQKRQEAGTEAWSHQ